MISVNTARRTLVLAAASALGLVAAAAPAAAQTPAEDAIEQIVSATMEAHDIPGAAVAVVSGGETETYGLGFADLEAEAPVDPERTGFPIDSVTKTFTATAVMALVDEGVLDLDADVNGYLDEVRVPDTYPGEPITLRHLLTHTAGFEERVRGLLAAPEGEGDGLEAHLLDHLPQRVRPPGEVTAYSNYGFALAAQVAADATGRPFAELLSEAVLQPLALDATAFGAAPTTATVHLEGEDGPEPYARGDEALFPAGGLAATAADMGRYMRFHLGDGGPVLSPEAAAEMHGVQFQPDPRLPGIALSLYETYHGTTRMLAHGGDGPGSHSLMTLVPEHGLGVFIAVNGDGRDLGAIAAVQSATDRILDLMLGESDLPNGPAGAEAPAGATEAVAGTYRTTRMNESDYTGLFLALGSDVTVTVAADGTVTTTGLTLDPEVSEQHWDPVGDGLYRERDGRRLIGFGDRDGQIALYDGILVYEHLPWHRQTSLHLIAAAAGLVLLASLLAWPAAAAVRRLRQRPRTGRGSPAAVALAAVTGLLIAGSLAAMAVLLAGGERMVNAVLEGSPVVALAAIPLALAAFGAVAMAVAAVVAWRRRWWGAARRIHYGAAALGALVFLAVAELYHFVSAPLTLLG